MNDRNKRISLVTIVFICLIAITVGYAAITTALKINGRVGLGKADFNIHFDNVGTVSHKATVNTEAHISDGEVKKEISFDVYLDKIGDDYKFTADIVNEGTIPGKVDSIELQGVSESQARILDYKLYYTGTTREVKPGDYWIPGAVKNTTFVLKYVIKDETLDSDLPTESTSLDLSLIIKFKSGDIDEFRSRAAATKLSQNTKYMSSDAVNYTNPTSSNEYEGLYYLVGTENNDFPIYFYRGGHDKVHNHVKFGGYCWRIIRTTETGGIKIIYNGTPDENGYCSNTPGENAQIGTYEMYNKIFDKNCGVAQYLNAWYFEHLIDYQAYLEDTTFCNKGTYDNGDVSLECAAEDQRSVANGKLSYPIGMLTAQEANLVGLTKSASTYSYIYTGVGYWVMTYETRKNLQNYNTVSYLVSPESHLTYTYGWYEGSYMNGFPYGVRPVVSLNSEVALTNGSGTPDDPFTVS